MYHPPLPLFCLASAAGVEEYTAAKITIGEVSIAGVGSLDCLDAR